MTSKDISSMLDDLMAHETELNAIELMSKQTASSQTATASKNSDHLFAIDKVMHELGGSDGADSDDILGFYDFQSNQNNTELVRQEEQHAEEGNSSDNALDLYQQAMTGKSVKHADAWQHRESDSRKGASTSIPPSLSRAVSFSTVKPITITYDDDIPLSLSQSSKSASRASSKKSILKTPTSATQPSEIPMIPTDGMDISSDDDGSSISDESESSGQGDQSDEEGPSDEEDEDIEVKEDDAQYASADLYGGGFGSKFHLDFPNDYQEDSLTDQMKVLLDRKLSQDEIKTAPSPAKQQPQQSGEVFLYFGQNSSSSSAPSSSPAVPSIKSSARRPSVDKNTPTTSSKQRKPSMDTTKRPPSEAESTDDDNVPIMQAFRRPSISETPKNVTAAESTQALMARITEGGNLRKITTRIYIETPATYETKVITSFMNADQVMKEVVEATLGWSSEEDSFWTVFELCSDIGIERPLRDWEIVTDVMSAWNNEESTNVLILKKYPYKSTLSLSTIRGTYPKSQGFIYLELTPGKWSKRFVELRQHSLYYLKNHKDPNSLTLLCSLTHFDVFSTFRPHRNAATPYCFGLRSDLNIAAFKGDKSEYVRFLCVEKEERLLDWVLALRMAKGERMVHLARNPELARDDELAINPTSSSSSNRSNSAAASRSGEGNQEVERKLTPGSLLENLEQSSSSKSGKKKSHSRSSTKAGTEKGERSRSKSSSSKSKKSSSSKNKKPKPLIDL